MHYHTESLVDAKAFSYDTVEKEGLRLAGVEGEEGAAGVEGKASIAALLWQFGLRICQGTLA